MLGPNHGRIIDAIEQGFGRDPFDPVVAVKPRVFSVEFAGL